MSQLHDILRTPFAQSVKKSFVFPYKQIFSTETKNNNKQTKKPNKQNKKIDLMDIDFLLKLKHLKGHWTTSASSPIFFFKKVEIFMPLEVYACVVTAY